MLQKSFLFLERRTGFFGQRIDRRMPDALRLLTTAAADDLAFEAEIVPVSLFWGRAPDRERSWFRLAIAEDWDIGGRFRKLLSLMLNGRNLLVLLGEPLPLQLTLMETRGMPRGPRRLWRQLRMQFRNQRAATIGPDLSHRRTIVAEVLRTKPVRDACARTPSTKKLKRREALKVARGYAVRDRGQLLARVRHLHGGRARPPVEPPVRRCRARQLRRACSRSTEGNEIVYVPCHRSHMDYLLLSYVVYHKGYAVPHIAAGINLNMPVVGSFLRRGGAFFLRRSFGGNADSTPRCSRSTSAPSSPAVIRSNTSSRAAAAAPAACCSRRPACCR